jgi:hypothetical protein
MKSNAMKNYWSKDMRAFHLLLQTMQLLQNFSIPQSKPVKYSTVNVRYPKLLNQFLGQTKVSSYLSKKENKIVAKRKQPEVPSEVIPHLYTVIY